LHTQTQNAIRLLGRSEWGKSELFQRCPSMIIRLKRGRFSKQGGHSGKNIAFGIRPIARNGRTSDSAIPQYLKSRIFNMGRTSPIS
jgi:hypothetical protein